MAEGEIKISLDGQGVHCKIDVRHISKAMIFGVFDALADGFKLNPLDRMLLASIFATGGLNKEKATSVEMNPEILEFIKKMKEKQNETDAL